jgi:hypothetical protein
VAYGGKFLLTVNWSAEMKQNLFVGLFCLLNISAASAVTTTDSGHITLMFANQYDELAISLDGGFPHAAAAGHCGGTSSWANVPKTMRATVMLAKALGKQVQVAVDGCYTNGGWLSGAYIYILD